MEKPFIYLVKVMRIISIIIVTILMTSGIWSCVSKKNISKNEIKKDSINVENNKVRVDTIYKERIKTITEPIYTEVEVPCDSTKQNQTFTSGKTSYKIIKEKGKVKVIFKKDSTNIICENNYKALYRENTALKSQISSFSQTQNKEVVKKPFFSGLWKILFFILLLLWAFGITPRYLFKLITRT